VNIITIKRSSPALGPVEKFFLCLLFFVILFPKGGVEMGGLPLTWSYCLTGFWFVIICLKFLKKGDCGSSVFRFALIFPFLILAGATVYGFGSSSVGMTVSLFVSSGYMSLLLCGIGPSFYRGFPTSTIGEVVRWAIGLVAVYGIVNFITTSIFNLVLFVPYLTTGVSEVEDLMLKYNMRGGGISKLISTYNNGNIYGVAILLLLPLADHLCLKKSNIFWLVSRVSLVLTLSRTVWVGLLVYELFSAFYMPGKGWRNALRILMVLGCISFGAFLVILVIGYDVDFLFDTTMGGRIDGEMSLSEIGFFATGPFVGIAEMTYLGVLSGFGWLGLLAFCVQFFSPILIMFFRSRLPKLVPAKCALVSLVVYYVVSLSDGGYLYTPIALYYWLVAGFFLTWFEGEGVSV
jgi:hypothetical protein